MHQDFVEAELTGGGPRDGWTTHMYSPASEIRYVVQADAYLISPHLEIVTEVYHCYRLVGGNKDKIWYRYQGYVT
jgi:hypothetical protein